jgi:hypothetical protein
MLQDAHSRKISEKVNAPSGDTIIVAAVANEWHYIHELIGDLSAAGTLEVIAINGAGAERNLGKFGLADGQGLTLQDEPGEDNRPRFEFKPGENAVLRTTGGTFIGSVHWSKRD